mgnify:CR=1 FL=1
MEPCREFEYSSSLPSVEDIIASYKTKKIKYYNPQLIGSQKIEADNNLITLVNRIPFKSNNAGANYDTTDEVADLKNFVVQEDPNLIFSKITLPVNNDTSILNKSF